MPLAAVNLYFHLKSGRVIHVTDRWDGVAPTIEGTVDANGDPDDGLGIEAGKPYRNIYRTALTGSMGPNTAIGLEGSVPGVGSVTASTSLTSLAVTPSLSKESDDVAGHAPRQYQKVVTRYVFKDLDTRPFYVPVEDLETWSTQAPID